MVEMEIKQLGKQGDGIAHAKGKEIYVPFTLPGETVSADVRGNRGSLVDIVRASEDRIEPVCKHFTKCGGCQLQHFDKDAYADWKQEMLREALAKHDINIQPEPLVTFPTGSRRKAVFQAARTDGELQFGFAQAGSHDITEVESCPVLVPELEALMPDIRDVAQMLPIGKRPIRLSTLITETGLDLAINGMRQPDEALRQALIKQAIHKGFARLSVEDEVLVEARKPELAIGIAKVVPPPSGFVQASLPAEQTMAELVCNHLSRCRSVIDLYSGMGTFALRMAEQSTVWALEESEPALKALDRAWRETAGRLKQLKVETRNLDRRPVSFQEMKKFDGLVFDPPRAGAEIQSRQIAKSKIGKVAAVSCNPVTLARDLSILVEGGYRISKIIPVDQFRYTSHLEVVALLEK